MGLMTMAPTGQAFATSLQQAKSVTSVNAACARMSSRTSKSLHLVHARQPMHVLLSRLTRYRLGVFFLFPIVCLSPRGGDRLDFHKEFFSHQVSHDG